MRRPVDATLSKVGAAGLGLRAHREPRLLVAGGVTTRPHATGAGIPDERGDIMSRIALLRDAAIATGAGLLGAKAMSPATSKLYQLQTE